MFTGLVEEMGTLTRIEGAANQHRLTIEGNLTTRDLQPGASICVSGCCLTVVDFVGCEMIFEAGTETLKRTKLGSLHLGSPVNLERSVAVGDRLGGHFVTGHVDGLGKIERREDEGTWSFFWVAAERDLLRQMASKGSITIDGVSLTLVEVNAQSFSVALIPHTLAVTTLGHLNIGDWVNLETDVLAKYVQRQLEYLNIQSS